MAIRIPESAKKPGVHYAVSSDGVELPVVDVTHPAFMLRLEAEDIAALREQDAAEHRDWQRKPALLRRLLFSLARRKSVFVQALKDGESGFLSGMNTYLMKLGPDNLGKGYTKPLDRRIASKAPFLNVRLRLQNMARLIADGLLPRLEAGESGPLRLVNIAGGPALDSINALILINQAHPRHLAGRPVRILVLDQDTAGPTFGALALQALSQPGGPLAGLDVAFERRHYNWGQPSLLGEVWKDAAGETLAAGSSEGGLFEYGDNATILANLEALRERSPAGFTMSGSLSLDLPHTRSSVRFARLPTRTFSLEAFHSLAGQAGWRVEQVHEGPMALCVRLGKR
ncbi:MAG: hypothetical protein P4L39_06130 [Humidesulfovibrio sp.]|nr:hypothetical protein [Humidesulfovibrio sp.]